jgi:hypothetical protein
LHRSFFLGFVKSTVATFSVSSLGTEFFVVLPWPLQSFGGNAFVTPVDGVEYTNVKLVTATETENVLIRPQNSKVRTS